MFHSLVAGAIIRYRDIAEQIEHRVVTLAGFNSGVTRFVIGLGKKVFLNYVLCMDNAGFAQLPAQMLAL